MNDSINFQKRIGWQGHIRLILANICQDYNLGKYIQHEIIPVGYEDFNLFLHTEKESYFVKIFEKGRNLKNCSRYIEIMQAVIEAGVKHPRLYKSAQGYLHCLAVDNTLIRLCVMQYIDGKNLYDLNETTSFNDIPFYAQQIALINKIDLLPTQVYDSWSISSFSPEYEKTKEYLDQEDRAVIDQLLKKFFTIDTINLPHCLVHGDIIKTNVLKDQKGDLYLLDCSVTNYYPRIQELAVLLQNILFDEIHPDSFINYYNLLLSQYQKYIPLTGLELVALPTYVQVAHAMHIIRPVYENKVNGNNTAENAYWLKAGKIGLAHTTKLWS